MDPLGLEGKDKLKIALYDGKDKGLGGYADGKYFAAAAKAKGDLYFDISNGLKGVLDKIKEIKKRWDVELDTVSIWDHGAKGAQEIGDSFLNPDSSFVKELGKLFKKIELKGCYVAKGKKGEKYIQEIATKTGTTVIGWTGEQKIIIYQDGTLKKTYNKGKAVIKKP